MPFDQPVPRAFTPEAIRSYAPLAPGVYGISNAREWIFIDESADIRGALLGILTGARTSVMRRLPTGFVFDVCDSSPRSERMRQLVGECAPVLNQGVSRAGAQSELRRRHCGREAG